MAPYPTSWSMPLASVFLDKPGSPALEILPSVEESGHKAGNHTRAIQETPSTSGEACGGGKEEEVPERPCVGPVARGLGISLGSGPISLPSLLWLS